MKEVFVMMNSDNDVVSGEYDDIASVIDEMTERGYTVEEMHKAGFTLNSVISDEKCWYECTGEYDY